MTSRKAYAQLVRGERIRRRGGGEGRRGGEGEGGEEDVIMTFSYVRMWWRFF